VGLGGIEPPTSALSVLHPGMAGNGWVLAGAPARRMGPAWTIMNWVVRAIDARYEEPGYKTADRLSATASQIVGAYVHVITDDVPGATTAQELGQPPRL
jgi:hypothetical protein